MLDQTDPEFALLGGEPSDEFDITDEANQALRTAPIITGDAFDVVGSTFFPQKALYGRILETSTGARTKSPKLYINSNAPFSGIVCGVQGSGKSHSTSVLLESCLICDRRLGTLPEPLSAILFHFDTAAGAGNSLQPCEAACIASLDERLGGDATPPKVVVLVLPNNLENMRDVYSRLPEVQVKPLHFAPEDLSGDRMLAMMKVEQDQQMPLYMECIMSILRGMSTFSYDKFRSQLKEQKFSGMQKAMLDIRLHIMDSCLEGGNASNRVSNYFEKGQLTIIDLSSPFMDGSSACGFFDIILGLFIQAKTEAFGKLVVLDEAHKYLTNSGSSSRLTDSLLSVIRQQRHLGTRVLISTQEPTVVPSKFLDLCSFVIAHRFSSQKWLDHLKEHISAVDKTWGSKVINLKTGEAMIFSPAALVLRPVPHGQDTSFDATELEAVATLGQGYLTVRSRKRITLDGGRSVMATRASPCGRSVTLPDGGSDSLSPKSGAESVQAPVLSFKAPCDIGQERSHVQFQFHSPDHVNSSSSFDNERSRSPSPSGISVAGKSPTPGITPAIPPNAVALKQPPPNLEARKEQSVIAESSGSPAPVPSIVREAATLTKAPTKPNPGIRFRHLISILKKDAKGQGHISFSELGGQLKKIGYTPYTKLGEYLKEAEQAKIVKIGGGGVTQWVALVDPVSQASQTYPQEYVPLVNAMREFLAAGQEHPARSDVAMKIYKINRDAVPGTFRQYISGAEATGIIVVNRDQDTLQLATGIR